MRFGSCINIDQIPVLRDAGYDYAELKVVDLRPDNDEATYAPIRRRIVEAGFDVDGCNVFIPAHHPVVGPGHDLPALRGYVTTALARMSELGARFVVFGSGRARGCPAGFDPAQAHAQIAEFLRMTADVASPLGIDVVIEPLARYVCNTLNTVVEGYDMAIETGRENVSTLADWWHVCHNEEPIESLHSVKPLLRHIHVPVPPFPDREAQPIDAAYDTFLSVLKATGYDLRVSVEDNGRRFGDLTVDAPAALAYLKARL